jgi:hypothetical protein
MQTVNHFLRLNGQMFSLTETSTSEGLSKSTYAYAELAAGYALHKKLLIEASIPYVVNTATIPGNASESKNPVTYQSFGDVRLQADYLVYSNTYSAVMKSQQFLYAFAGVELPSGNFNSDFRVQQSPPSLSTGSESVDVYAGLNYKYSKPKWYITTAYGFKLNTENPDRFKFGNQHTAELYAGPVLQMKSMRVVPLAGLYLNSNGPDTYYGAILDHSRSTILMAKANVDCSLDMFTFGIQAGLPVYARLDDTRPDAGWLMRIYSSYYF